MAETNSEGIRSLPDTEFVKTLISRQFYIKGIAIGRELGTTAQLIDFLHARRLDPWSAIDKRLSVDGNAAIRRSGFGLRVLKFNENLFYMLPEIGSPNEGNKFQIYQTLNSPAGGNWADAMDSGEIQLLDAKVLLKKRAFLARGIRIESAQVRIDDFVNPSLSSIFLQRSAELGEVNIVDLRFNSGGRVDLAAQLARLLVGVDLPLGSIERRGDHSLVGSVVPLDNETKTKVRDRATSLVVLVSRFTASTAEWLARNLQVYGATILGERSTGKCLIHRSFAIGAGQSLKLAVGRLHVASQSENDRGALYDYCEFGLIPDRWVNGRLLVSQPAEWLAQIK